ncbi:trigger factor [Paenibacillus sp. J31TS4]|uniref:trigger factor n=1 Tax=Paenibacillus sp. J31TS4 TaxID=2807195 RepID=UPI001B081702|nr:trigger factor [Paenibacillus sp. J31TS4]GIP39165.1 trigger factor [Paenibacillus sp. J31TS4]
MKASWEKIEKNQGVLTVEVEAERVNAALDKAFKKVASRVNVPGFRKGKVPRQIFESRFGVESLYQDALDILLPEAYIEAVDEAGIEPIDRPEVDVQQLAKGQALKFTAKVDVKPEVELGEYKGLEVTERSSEVSEEEINNELEQLRKRHAELTVVEDGAAEEGDITVIDFEGFLDGEAFEGGKAENYSLELGSNSFIPGFESQVVGMKKDEEKDLDITFPEDYHSEELKGKQVVFKVKVHEIKRKNLPELDDEFAKDVSEFETLDEYKEDLKKNLQERKEQNNRVELENELVDKAAANATVEVPDVLVENEISTMMKDFENRLRMQGLTIDMYFQFSGQDEAALKEQMRGDAEKRVRNNLVLEAIASAENLSASDEDVDAEIEKMAKLYQREADELKSILEENGNLDNMKKDLGVRKAIDLLIENSKAVANAE